MSSEKWHGGKGSHQRPTDRKKFSDNFDAIFGKRDEKKKIDEEIKTLVK